MNSADSTKQHVFRLRRQYNQWVNNQTLEDYALRFTAKKARKWSLGRVANTALGAISFLALEAIGGAITISFGFEVAITSILAVGLIIFLAGIPICYYAAKYGVDIDLLTRGAGFGYIGSTITSLIYASFTFIFFALEAAIMAAALKLLFGLPLVWGYLASSIIIIPLVTHGITFISRFQLWTQPIWIILQLIPLVYIFNNDLPTVTEWLSFDGIENQHNGQVTLAYFGAATAILFALIAQIGEQVDFLRFLPQKTQSNRKRWWAALMVAGPGWVVVGIIKMLIGSLLAYLVWNNGGTMREATDPANMYLIAFGYVFPSPQVALIVACVFVILCQIKINVTNAYAGSIAWSNFFSRLTHNHPGRVVWLVFNVAIALMLMELGIYQTFEHTLGVYAVVAVGWVATLVADLIICKPLKLSPPGIEFKRAHLYDINPVGVVTMIISTALGAICYLGVIESLTTLSHFVTIISALILAPIIAYLTRGKYYLARESSSFSAQELKCVVCQNQYEVEDIATCPAYGGNICSLCCSLDARCHDQCKPSHSIYKQANVVFKKIMPESWGDKLGYNFSRFVLLFLLANAITSCLLYFVYINGAGDSVLENQHLANILLKTFILLMIVIGVICWLFVLAHESMKVAQQESQTQNQLLVQEILAHEKTDAELQSAKEHAESANNAKSRYLTGISHELRSPLNSILGYAQLMESQDELDNQQKIRVSNIKKSGEYLADLIEGLLDISRIEAGRMDVHKDRINFTDLIDQLVYMFSLQAKEKGLDFYHHQSAKLPKLVLSDEKHIRQILINLLSNAIKYTKTGKVEFTTSYRNQVARFTIADTGGGILEKDMERVFKPFERIRTQDYSSVTGTGLGLTITRLLTEILGGDLRLTNNDMGGLSATVALMLPSTFDTDSDCYSIDQISSREISGYKGKKKTISVVDDNAMHRGIIGDALTELGFIVFESPSAEACLSLHIKEPPDLYIIDIEMPEKNGWELIQELRELGFKKPIVVVSANAKEYEEKEEHDKHIDAYLTKPIKISSILKHLASLLKLEWIHKKESSGQNIDVDLSIAELPCMADLIKLKSLVNIGHLSGLHDALASINLKGDQYTEFTSRIEKLIGDVQLETIKLQLDDALKQLEDEAIS